jgi:Mrp family chromosome partitioning ATPase
VDAEIGDTDPAAAVRAYLADHEVDEIIVSTLPQRISRWLRRDVPSQLEGVGLPVTVIIAEQSDRTVIT